jgi:hypothetical protein
MIKIDNPNLDQISKEYFDHIKYNIILRSEYYLKVLTVLLNPALVNTISSTGRPPGKTKKFLINLLLRKNKLKTQKQFNNVVSQNCYKWVTVNHILLTQIATYLKSENNLKELILCKPEDTIAIENKVKAAIGITPAIFKKNIKAFINNIVDYSLFNQYAYDIASKLNVNTCPYCNRNYINTVIDKKGKNIIRPTFDHFFPKSKHPFLALSFYNLVPSCYFCNSSLKSADIMDISTHIHPYKEGFDNDTTFQIIIKDCKPNKSDPDNYTLFFLDNMDETSINDRYRKIFGGSRTVPNPKEGNLNLFKLTDIYQSHLDIVGELVLKCDSLNSDYADSLYKMFGLLKTNKSEFYQYYFGNYFSEKDFNRRPMAKLTKDIVSQVLPMFVK